MGGDLMYLEENKKVLFVMGTEQELDYGYMKQRYNISPENIIILERDELDRIQPFGDLMRDILLNVYQKNIEEIVIVATKEDRKNTEDRLRIIGENKDLQKNIGILDYLFIHCKPELPDRTIREWFEGSTTLIDDIQNTVEVIRHHPLMPLSVKVKELWLDQENEKQFEIDVFCG
jgi:carbonic anhydrase